MAIPMRLERTGAYHLAIARPGYDHGAVTRRPSYGQRTLAQMLWQALCHNARLRTGRCGRAFRSPVLHLIRESLAYNCPNFEALLRQIAETGGTEVQRGLLELESLFPYRKHAAVSCKLAFTRDQIKILRERLANPANGNRTARAVPGARLQRPYS